MTYDSKSNTLEHILVVNGLIMEVVSQLLGRALSHDQSKLKSPEKEYFDKYTPKLSGVTYGSDEYRAMLKAMKPAIDHHHQTNRHHPEYHGLELLNGMDLIDLVEMLCDWKAATLRHHDGDIRRSLEVNADRFKMSSATERLLLNTIHNMGWIKKGEL